MPPPGDEIMTRRTNRFPALLAAGLILAAAPAAAGPPCAPHEAMVRLLSKTHREVPAGIGTIGDGLVAELWVSETGSWTLLLTNGEGVSCLRLAGQGWDAFMPDFTALEPKT